MVWKGKVEKKEATQNGDKTLKKRWLKKIDLSLVFCKLKPENKPVAKALLFSK